MLNVISLLSHRVKKVKKVKCYPDISIIIPSYNVEDEIIETLESVINSDYPARKKIIVVDDGSSDNTLEIIESHFSDYITLIKNPHRGKAHALNCALKHVDTQLFITLDSDTALHKNAITNIVDKMLEKDYAAVAGALIPKNEKDSFTTKMQGWDYSIGIYGIKLFQSFYNSTLVTQGAFSIYKTQIVEELGGWQDSIGEDIILTWSMLKKVIKLRLLHTQ